MNKFVRFVFLGFMTLPVMAQQVLLPPPPPSLSSDLRDPMKPRNLKVPTPGGDTADAVVAAPSWIVRRNHANEWQVLSAGAWKKKGERLGDEVLVSVSEKEIVLKGSQGVRTVTLRKSIQSIKN